MNLTIVKSMTGVLSRPKYRPTLKHSQWVVWDSDSKKRVFGPAVHAACIKFIDNNRRK